MANNQGANKPNHELRVYSDVSQLIASLDNPTPLVKVNRLNTARIFDIYVKLERYNPFGSVKDRIVFEMLSALKTEGKTIVEPSSGNTGIALAALANAIGVPIEIAVPERIPEEKKVMLRFLGAKLHEADDALCPLFPTEGARGLVNALINSPRTKDRYVSPNQYENELNVRAHYRTTGPEIWKQTEGRITHLFAGLGTCGTISGVGKFLKEKNPGIKVIGIEPASADHKLPGLKRITGLAEEFIPKILDRSVIDEIVPVEDRDAYRTAAELARRDGILVGPTTGAALSAALRQSHTGAGLAVVIAPDDAFKYAGFYADYLKQEADEARSVEFDLCQFICPLSKIKATEALDSLAKGETLRLVLGDTDSLKSVVAEIKTRGLKPKFQQEDDKYVLLVTK